MCESRAELAPSQVDSLGVRFIEFYALEIDESRCGTDGPVERNDCRSSPAGNVINSAMLPKTGRFAVPERSNKNIGQMAFRSIV